MNSVILRRTTSSHYGRLVAYDAELHNGFRRSPMKNIEPEEANGVTMKLPTWQQNIRVLTKDRIAENHWFTIIKVNS